MQEIPTMRYATRYTVKIVYRIADERLRNTILRGDNMANFDSGVASFISGHCEIEVNFPVDDRGRADISCNQCPYYGRSSKTCQLNKQVVHYPEKYTGFNCPLTFENKEE
jgi:hypothetical protein